MDHEAEPAASRTSVWWLLHPLLVAAFPVVFLFAQNVNDQISLEPLWMPLAVAVGAGAVVLLLALGVGRALGVRPERAALAASLVVAMAMTYGHVWSLVEEAVRLHRYMLAVWVGIGVVGLLLVLRLRAHLVERASVALTVAIAGLLLLNAVPVAGLGLRAAALNGGPTASDEPGPTAAPGSQRDVWYIVLDRYAGLRGLSESFGFDNRPFVDALAERGFEVAEEATANYLKTAPSLLSSLNMAELDIDAFGAEATGGDDWGPIHRRLADSHAVERFLHERGYRYVHVGSQRGPTATNEAADISYAIGQTTEFGAVLAGTTILAALERVAPRVVPTGIQEFIPAQTEFQLEVLDDLADEPGPNFVFAHLLLPHPPYAFNADGSRVTDEQRRARSVDEQYIEQVKFTNAAMLALVDRLHAGPPEEWPIVVIAADEGPFPERYATNETDFQWLEATPDEMLRKFSILMAISIPGVDRAGLEAAGYAEDLTPVNLFRVVFNAAFGADLPLLPERNWIFPDHRHLYDAVDATDRVRS